MQKFIPLTEPEGLDFFSICEDKGVKYIHIFGYCYESEDIDHASDENPNGVCWGNLECSWFIEPLSEFIAHLNGNENYVDETYCDLNPYQDNYTPEEMTDIINHYFDGHGADAYLGFGELTMDTPCGDYVC